MRAPRRIVPDQQHRRAVSRLGTGTIRVFRDVAKSGQSVVQPGIVAAGIARQPPPSAFARNTPSPTNMDPHDWCCAWMQHWTSAVCSSHRCQADDASLSQTSRHATAQWKRSLMQGHIGNSLSRGVVENHRSPRAYPTQSAMSAHASAHCRSSKMSSRHSSRPRSSILYKGMILEAWTMAMSRPASMA